MIHLARYVKFVKYAAIEDHFRAGWVILIPKQAAHHDHYGVELGWICDCPVAHRVPEASQNAGGIA